MVDVKVGQKWRGNTTGAIVEVVDVQGDVVTVEYPRGPFGRGVYKHNISRHRDSFRFVCDPNSEHNCGTAATEPVRSTAPQAARDGNPKDAIGSKKAPTFCVPVTIQMEDGLAMFEGERKYGRHNYRAAPVRASVYVDAARRHMARWIEGEELDPDSGLSHLMKARACFGIIRDAQINGTLIDDRPISKVPAGYFDELDKKAAAIVDKHPKTAAPHVRQPIEVEFDALKARTLPR